MPVRVTKDAAHLVLTELMASDIAAWRDIWCGSLGLTGRIELLTTLRLIWLFPGLRATLLYRLSHALHRRGVKLLPHLLSQLNLIFHGFDIPASVPIGARLYIPHPVGTVVMADRIGTDVTLVSSVTIGMRKGPGFPTIGDNVYVGAGARVLGGITIGNNVSIGANAVVLTDVPENSVAVGVPARVRSGGSKEQVNRNATELNSEVSGTSAKLP